MSEDSVQPAPIVSIPDATVVVVHYSGARYLVSRREMWRRSVRHWT